MGGTFPFQQKAVIAPPIPPSPPSLAVSTPSNFDAAIALVLIHEGSEYTDDPNDSGGPTKYGITMTDLTTYYGGGTYTPQDVQDVTPQLAGAIYRKLYWDKLNLDGVKDTKLASVIMDQGVLRGIGHISSVVQAIVGVTVDGIMGPITIKAIDQLIPSNISLAIINQEIVNYVAIVKGNPSQMVFLAGWENRMCSLLNFVFKVGA